jgi:hypothetical protein
MSGWGWGWGVYIFYVGGGVENINTMWAGVRWVGDVNCHKYMKHLKCQLHVFDNCQQTATINQPTNQPTNHQQPEISFVHS